MEQKYSIDGWSLVLSVIPRHRRPRNRQVAWDNPLPVMIFYKDNFKKKFHILQGFVRLVTLTKDSNRCLPPIGSIVLVVVMRQLSFKSIWATWSCVQPSFVADKNG